MDRLGMQSPLNNVEEATPHEKQRNINNAINVFKKGNGGYNSIRTFGIVSAENPNSQEVDRKLNKKATRDLSKSLSSAHYGFVRQRGHFGGNEENSYFIFNIKLEVLTYYAAKYEQTSFFYCTIEDRKVVSEYWQKKSTGLPYDKIHNPYVMLEKTDNWLDASDSEDFSIIGNRFKYTIPLKIFENCATIINDNIRQMLSEDAFKNNNVKSIVELADNCAGIDSWYYRQRVYKGLFDTKENI